MRHYHNLQEVFEELCQENMLEIEGKVEINGRYYLLTGETIPLIEVADSELQDPKKLYKIMLEEYKPTETRTLWSKD